MKLELSQFNEMQSFAQFSSDLDDSTKKILEHGKKVYSILKQPQYSPLDQSVQIIILFAIKNHLIEEVPFDYIDKFKENLIDFIKKDPNANEIAIEINNIKEITKELNDRMMTTFKTFVDNFIISNGIVKNNQNKETGDK